MKRLCFVSLVLVVGLLSAGALHAGTDYYVQSVKAKVMSGPSFKSDVIQEVAKGQKLASSGKEGSWVKVKIADKDGYVPSLVVSTHPPLEKTGVIKGEDGEIKQGVRRRASSYTSAAAARGLASDDRKRQGQEEKIDYDSLEKMEAFTLSPQEVARFMEGKKL